MTVKELIEKLSQLDENAEVKLLNDITFTADTYRRPELPHEFPYKVEAIEDVTQGIDIKEDEQIVFIHAVGGALY